MTTIETMKSMHARCFSEEHFVELHNTYQEFVTRGDFEEVESEYKVGKEALTAKLSSQQAAWLAEIEEAYKANFDYAARYGFDTGLYTGFQRYFAAGPKDKCDVDEVLENGLFTAVGMERHVDFFQRNKRCLELLNMLNGALPADVYYHVTSVDCAWAERIHFAAMEQFYLGYRSALEVLDRVQPTAKMKMVPDTLLIEYELGRLESNDRLEELAKREREAKENG